MQTDSAESPRHNNRHLHRRLLRMWIFRILPPPLQSPDPRMVPNFRWGGRGAAAALPRGSGAATASSS
eukprot:3040933-Prorocentrum_lima.AAC.1